jgi:hypothetical protein
MGLRDQGQDTAANDRPERAVRLARTHDGDGLAPVARALSGFRVGDSAAISPRDVVALQRSVGNHAVGQLMRQASPGAATLDLFIPDSASPDKSAGTARPEAQEEPASDAQAASPLSRQLHPAAAGLLQRKEDDTAKLCPRYWRYDKSHGALTYNCAGLAWRTYDYRGDIDAERSAAAAGGAPGNKPGEVKHWFWEYDLHLETDSGLRGPEGHDFHTVAGVVDKAGKDPDDVYSKNGGRPVYGPGTGPSWKPAARDRATSNDPSETPAKTDDGQALYKVRSNFKEIITSHPCKGA